MSKSAKGKKKTLKKTQLPVGSVLDENPGCNVEYLRKDHGEFIVPLKNVKPRLDGHGKINTAQSVQLFWRLPKDGDERGSLEKLGECHIKLENTGRHILQLTIMQPLGYEAAPCNFAGWKVLVDAEANREFKPGQKLTVHCKFVGNNVTVPKRTFHKGYDCVHVASMAFTRTLESVGGNVPQNDIPDQEVGFQGSIDVTYVSFGSDVATVDSVVMRVLDTSEHMGMIDQMPLPEMTIGALSAGTEKVEAAIVSADYSESKKYGLARLSFQTQRWNSAKEKYEPVEIQPEQLDPKAKGYVLSEGVISGVIWIEDKAVSDFAYCTGLRYYPAGTTFGKDAGKITCTGGWYLCASGNWDKADGTAVFEASGSYKGNCDGIFLGGWINLKPVSLYPMPKPVKMDRGGHGKLIGKLRDADLYIATKWIDTTLDVLTTVVKVIRVAAVAVATVGSVLADPEQSGITS